MARTVLLAWLVAGTLDILSAFVFAGMAGMSPGGVLHRLLGKGELTVNSVHYQGIGRLAPAEQVDDGLVDLLVLGQVEVAAPDHLGHVADGVFAEQHGPEHRLLGLHVLRRGAIGRGELARVFLVRGKRRE